MHPSRSFTASRLKAIVAGAIIAPMVMITGGGVLKAAQPPSNIQITVTPNLVGAAGNNVAANATDGAPGFPVGSFVASATVAGAKTEMYFSPTTLFGRDDIKLEEIAGITYFTKTGATHAADPRDWYLNIYTEFYPGDVSTPGWYGDRLGAEPYFAKDIADPANTWNQWSLDGATNQLRWFESTQGAVGATFGSYTDPDWFTRVSGNALSGQPYAAHEVLYFSVQTASAWANGFTGQLDGLRITLDDGSTATINFEPNTPACTTVCYVNAATGNDLNGGATAGDAKKTIQAGVNAVNATGTVNVAAGTYAEAVTIAKALTLHGAGVAGTIVDGTTGTGQGITIASGTSGVAGVAISDLTVQRFGNGIHMVGTFSNISVTDVASTLNAVHGIFVAGGDQSGLSFTRVNSSNNGGAGSGGRGLWIIDGVKTGITVVDGTYNSNALVGIDVNDGTVTGLTITGNEVTGNGDSGIGVLGAQGPGANVVADNEVTNNGRYGIEIKVPNGSGSSTGAASMVVSHNVVTRTVDATDARDYAGIAVFRRAGNPALNADQPVGVVVTGNTVSGFHRKPIGSTGDGFGIVVEGTNHTVDHNTVSSNDVGIQIQAGNTANVQSTDYFDRGDASVAGAMINRNSITGNTVQLRNVGAPQTDATCNWWGSSAGPGAIPGATTAPFLTTSNLDGACTPTVSVSAAGATVNEGSAAGFTISLSQAPTAPVTVSYATVNGTASSSSAAVGGADYTATTGSVTFNPGDPLTKNVSVSTTADTTDEFNETFSLDLTGATNAQLGTTSATTTIVDNDAAPKITIRDAATVEGNPFTGSTTKTITFSVRVGKASAKPISATFTTRNATGLFGAAAPTDFVAATGTVTINPGSTSGTVTVTVNKDRTRERDEQFFVDLSGPVNASFNDATGRGVITNDD